MYKKTSKTKKFLSLLFLGLIATWFLLPHHLRMALTYWYPGIEDYSIFDNRTVANSDDVYTWPIHSRYNTNRIPQNERDTLEYYQTIAFLVIQNDSILYEEYWDNYNNESITNSFSMAKSIVGLLIGAAIEDGFITSADQKVGDFIPHFKKGKNKELTIRHLLTMSSGSNWDESYTSPLSLTTKAYYGNNLSELVNELDITSTPGELFEYKSGDTQLLAEVLKIATKKTLSQYASEKLWQPLGAHAQALWSLDKKDGTEKAYCCFNSNARDFALLGELILHKGWWRGKQLIPEAYIAESTSISSLHLKDAKTGEVVDFYGQQWWLIKYNNLKIPYARGILGQYIFVIPEKNAIIVRLGHQRSKYKINHHPTETYSYLKTGLDMLK